jgi:acetyl-CoA synthetase
MARRVGAWRLGGGGRRRLWYILGRSDDTIKIAGKRLGPAEVESVLVAHPAVVRGGGDRRARRDEGQRWCVFCVLAPGIAASDSLAAELRRADGRRLGKPLAPKAVLFVSDLPKTRNAKVMRRVMRAPTWARPAGDTSSLVNPEGFGSLKNLTQRSLRTQSTPRRILFALLASFAIFA